MIFSDKILANYFPQTLSTPKPAAGPNAPKPAPTGGLVYTNVAVLNYISIKSLETWIKDIHTQKEQTKDMNSFEKNMCYTMFQILNGALSLHDGTSLYTIKRLKLKDILIVSRSITEPKSDSLEEYLVINPLQTCQQEYVEEEVLCQDLFCILVSLMAGPQTKASSQSVPTTEVLDRLCNARNSTIMSTMKLCGRTLASATSVAQLMVARSMLQFVLWGPQESEIKSLLLAKDREHAFCVWLELMRCRCINELALEQVKPSLEVAHRFHFLCSITGTTMFELSKMLHVRHK